MRVVILEPAASGHRLTYVRLIAQALERLPVEVTFATSEKAVESIEYNQQIKPLTPRLGTAPICSYGSGVLGSALAKWRSLRHVIRDLRPDHVYIPYVDGLAQIMGIARLAALSQRPHGCEIEGLLMRGGFAYPQDSLWSSIQSQVSFRMALLAPLDMLHLIDPIPFDRAQSTFPQSAARLSLLPDPIEEVPDIGKEEARRQLGIPSEGRYIGCSGALDTRKGVDRLIRAFTKATLDDDVRLLLVGRTAASIQELLKNEVTSWVNQGRIVCIDRYVTDQELGWANIAADVICTPYPHHIGSASIVIRAAAARRPVLGSDFGWIGYVVPRFGLGWTCDVSDVEVFAAALRRAIDSSIGWNRCVATSRFVDFHSVANFQAHWTDRLRRGMDLPHSQHLIRWVGVNDAASTNTQCSN